MSDGRLLTFGALGLLALGRMVGSRGIVRGRPFVRPTYRIESVPSHPRPEQIVFVILDESGWPIRNESGVVRASHDRKDADFALSRLTTTQIYSGPMEPTQPHPLWHERNAHYDAVTQHFRTMPEGSSGIVRTNRLSAQEKRHTVKISICHKTLVSMNKILQRDTPARGWGENETIRVFTANFGDGFQADIVVENGSGPYINAVLFKDGNEVSVIEPSWTLEGAYVFDLGGKSPEQYVVEIEDGGTHGER